MLNILGEGSGPQGKRKAEELMARAMQASPSPAVPPPFFISHAFICLSVRLSVCLSDLLSV